MSIISLSFPDFNPLPLCRGRQVGRAITKEELDISILSLYTEGDEDIKNITADEYISILSLYTEGDVYDNGTFVDYWDFNPLPLYRGRHTF